jgi:hypothetical protein
MSWANTKSKSAGKAHIRALNRIEEATCEKSCALYSAAVIFVSIRHQQPFSTAQGGNSPVPSFRMGFEE